MPKNIIVCADGTGNKGGDTQDTNVYKIYKAVDKHFKGTGQDNFKEQVIFYDNGVGTETNKYLRALGGAFGFGFKRNVCDLYKFLARNYETGDRVYFFGFSRGASTVRACNGFISICGLFDGSDRTLSNQELDRKVKEAFEAYRWHGIKGKLWFRLTKFLWRRLGSPCAKDLKEAGNSHGEIPIHFMGVWDTVVALGFPSRTDITGPVSFILNILLWLLEKGLDLIWPHNFYYYKLTNKVEYAYQALAIDDERTSFWPHVWREQGREDVCCEHGRENNRMDKNRKEGKVEQVWFSGMHSNVGGGYGRSGMASVALHWMMLRAQSCGLQFEDGTVGQAFDDSHEHGRMYNSRGGFGFFYRYHPREIEQLCEGRLKEDIRIHRSVIERINHRTANYAPGQIPARFEVVESDPKVKPVGRNPGKHPDWDGIRKTIDKWVLRRKGLYAFMLTFVVTIFVSAYRLWACPPKPEKREGLSGHLADVLDYILPDYFAGLIEFTVVQNTWWFIGAVVLVIVYMYIRGKFRQYTVQACERLRHLIITEADIIESENRVK